MTSSERGRTSGEFRIGRNAYAQRQIAGGDGRPDDVRCKFNIDRKIRRRRRRRGAANVAVLAGFTGNQGRVLRTGTAGRGRPGAVANNRERIGCRSITGRERGEGGEQDVQGHGVKRHDRHTVLEPPDHRMSPPVPAYS